MTLSGHTSTLPRLVVWGAVFQNHLLDSAQTPFCTGNGTYYNRGRDVSGKDIQTRDSILGEVFRTVNCLVFWPWPRASIQAFSGASVGRVDEKFDDAADSGSQSTESDEY